MSKKKRSSAPIVRALEEARYGAQGLLNLRESLPTEREATARAEAWIRERQVLGIDRVVIVTGRGQGSAGGVPVVREGIRKLLGSLRRRGVIDAFSENGPGAFFVQIAPLKKMLEAPRRRRDSRSARVSQASPAALAHLAGLDSESREALRRLAEASLLNLGIQPSPKFLEEEMIKQFSAIVSALPAAPDRDQLLRDALHRAIEEYDAG